LIDHPPPPRRDQQRIGCLQDLSQSVLASYLEPYASYDVWHFKNPLHVMRSFDNPSTEAEFQKRMRHVKPMF